MDVTPNPERPPILPHEEPFFRRIHPVGFALLSLAIIFVLYQVVAGGFTLLIARGRITEDNVALVRWSTLVGQLLFILLPTIVLAYLRGVRPLEFFRVRVPDTREIILTVIGVFSLQQILQAYMILQQSIPFPPEIQRIVDMLKSMFEETYRVLVSAQSPAEFFFVVIAVALVPAVSEEMLFRGLIQRSVEQTAGGLRGAILTGIIFGAYHLNPFSLIPLIALGMYFGFLVYRSQNVIVAVSSHFFNNFIACSAVYLNLHDDFVALAPGGGLSGTVLLLNTALFLALFVGATALFILVTADRRSV